MSYICGCLCDVLAHSCGTTRLWALIEQSERFIRTLGPLYALGAASLVLLDAFVFFTTVLTEINKASGFLVAATHAVIGAWLLFNVLFNHVMCAVVSPGTTLEADPQDLRLAMTNSWRWCSTCERGKPPLAHHCSICNSCILKMDHHCVWMSNCIGFFNYRYFFLYLYWMWVGSIYSIVMTFVGLKDAMRARTFVDKYYYAFVVLVLAISVFMGLGILLGWHMWLVLTGQGTIDAMGARARAANGQPWRCDA